MGERCLRRHGGQGHLLQCIGEKSDIATVCIYCVQCKVDFENTAVLFFLNQKGEFSRPFEEHKMMGDCKLVQKCLAEKTRCKVDICNLLPLWGCFFSQNSSEL